MSRIIAAEQQKPSLPERETAPKCTRGAEVIANRERVSDMSAELEEEVRSPSNPELCLSQNAETDCSSSRENVCRDSPSI